ncbi:MAG: hypothetical protein GC129_03535 [Proteobacteria bacterium]|nr:hypothetical protein [Pseudomonadota bacterium]
MLGMESVEKQLSDLLEKMLEARSLESQTLSSLLKNTLGNNPFRSLIFLLESPTEVVGFSLETYIHQLTPIGEAPPRNKKLRLDLDFNSGPACGAGANPYKQAALAMNTSPQVVAEALLLMIGAMLKYVVKEL